MKSHFIVLILTISFALSVRPMEAQTSYELGLFVGISNYAGDLVKSLGPRFEENGLGAGIVGKANLTQNFGVRGNLLVGTLFGDDYNYLDRQQRGYKFNSFLAELSAMGEWEPLGRRRFYTDARGKVNMHNLISPYLFAGVGLGFVDYDVTFARFEPDKSQNPTLIEDKAFGSSTTVLSIPVGLGVKFDFHPHFSFGLEISARYPFSDYIDGISAAANDKSKDWYYFGGATLSYRFLSDLLRTHNRRAYR